MPLPVSLKTIGDELSLVSEQSTAYINRRTGDVFHVSDEHTLLIEDAADEDEELERPDWEREHLAQVREVLDGGDWAALPDAHEIHEWNIMRDFAASVPDERLRNELLDAIHGRGAFRMFRSAVERAGQRAAWFAYRDAALREIARAALDELGIPYVE